MNSTVFFDEVFGTLPRCVETLADRIGRDGPLDELDAVGWAIRLAKRVEAMHSLGVAHGCLSPTCILIEGRERSARAQLLDVRRASAQLAYQSPERIAGGPISQADDAWALACTLYTALTGSAPFSGAGEAELRQKITAASPAPLAVFDVGDDDLQRIFDEAFAKEVGKRLGGVAAFRARLEEWHPDPNAAALPAIDDEDTATGLPEDEDDEDERTIMRPAPGAMAAMMQAARPAAPAPVVPAPRASNPGVIPAPRASNPGVIPAPRGSQPGLVPPARASNPGAIPAPRASNPGVIPAPRASQSRALPQAVPPPRTSQPGLAATPRGSHPDLSPPAPPPVVHTDDEEDDEKTMMRSVPDTLASVLGARAAPTAARASQSGAFPASSAARSGSFPAVPVVNVPDVDAEPGEEDEATRMMQAPSLLAALENEAKGADAPVPDEDDDDQKTMMRSSLSPEEEAARNAASDPRQSGVSQARSRPLPAAGFVEPVREGVSSPDADTVKPPARNSVPGEEPAPVIKLDAPPTPNVSEPAASPPAASAPAPENALVPAAAAAAAAPRSSNFGFMALLVVVLIAAAAAAYYFLRMR